MTLLPFFLWSNPSLALRIIKPYQYRRRMNAIFPWNSNPLAVIILLVSLLNLPIIAYAAELFDTVQIHGFASQAMFLTSGNNMFEPSMSNPSFAFTELGINGSWSPLPKLRFSMQVLSRRAGDWHNGTPVIDFGLIDYSYNFNNDYSLGVRAGRVRQPYGLYNDTRDVAFTRPSILLPQSIYFEGTRDFTISADGIMLYGESRKPWGNLTLELLGGYARTDDKDTQFSFLLENLPGKLEPNPSFVGRLNYETVDKSSRLALSGVYSSMQYKSKHTLDEPAGGTINFNAMVISAQYNTDKWTLSSEYSPNFLSRTGSGIYRDYDNFGQSYYFQVAYRFSPNWELMGRYDAFYPNSDDPRGNKFEAATGLPAYSQFAKNWTVGLRYDITPWMMVRAEYNYINGTGWVPYQGYLDPKTGNLDFSKTVQYWDMFGFLVSLRF
jgi:hypothetical protein